MAPVIALTGGIGSGKSSVAAIFKELGAAIIDTDEIAHQLTAPGQPGARAIGAQFGSEYLLENGALDRERMRKLAFADPAAKKKLEAILHPLIRAKVDTELKAARSPYVVIVVPLLLETGAYRELARRVLVIDCSEDEQIARVTRRSALAPDTVRAIMASQVGRAERLKHADDIIRNETSRAALRAQVVALHRKYFELAKASGSTA